MRRARNGNSQRGIPRTSRPSTFGEKKPNPLQLLRILWGESKYSRLGAKAFELREQGRAREAMATFHQAITTVRKLHEDFPDAYAHPMGQLHWHRPGATTPTC